MEHPQEEGCAHDELFSLNSGSVNLPLTGLRRNEEEKGQHSEGWHKTMNGLPFEGPIRQMNWMIEVPESTPFALISDYFCTDDFRC